MTRERAAEAALRDSEERFRVAFEKAPIGVSLIDLEGNFLQVNDAYCQTVRRSREELMRLGPAGITHPDDVALTQPRVDLARRGRRARPALREALPRRARRVGLGRDQRRACCATTTAPRSTSSAWSRTSASGALAHTLQRSMLTTQLPAVDGVELSARYLPGTRQTEVSGDWYDVIPLPDGRVGVVIGDVVGRGIEAAATMSQLRTALRAYAVEGLEPAGVVGEAAPARRPPARRPEHDARVPRLRSLHPRGALRQRRPPAGVHVPADGPSAFLPGARSTPLGAAPVGAPIPQERIVLAPGDGVLLYTDGLVERRDVGIDRRLQQLLAAVAGRPDDLPSALDHLTATLLGDETLRHDDVALLALRVTPAAASRPSTR